MQRLRQQANAQATAFTPRGVSTTQHLPSLRLPRFRSVSPSKRRRTDNSEEHSFPPELDLRLGSRKTQSRSEKKRRQWKAWGVLLPALVEEYRAHVYHRDVDAASFVPADACICGGTKPKQEVKCLYLDRALPQPQYHCPTDARVIISRGVGASRQDEWALEPATRGGVGAGRPSTRVDRNHRLDRGEREGVGGVGANDGRAAQLDARPRRHVGASLDEGRRWSP